MIPLVLLEFAILMLIICENWQKFVGCRMFLENWPMAWKKQRSEEQVFSVIILEFCFLNCSLSCSTGVVILS